MVLILTLNVDFALIPVRLALDQLLLAIPVTLLSPSVPEILATVTILYKCFTQLSTKDA